MENNIYKKQNEFKILFILKYTYKLFRKNFNKNYIFKKDLKKKI